MGTSRLAIMGISKYQQQVTATTFNPKRNALQGLCQCPSISTTVKNVLFYQIHIPKNQAI
jgi:hypothetical protein